jgi:hypothetical protein
MYVLRARSCDSCCTVCTVRETKQRGDVDAAIGWRAVAGAPGQLLCTLFVSEPCSVFMSTDELVTDYEGLIPPPRVRDVWRPHVPCTWCCSRS